MRTSFKVHPAIAVTIILLSLAAIMWMLWPVHQVVGQFFGIALILLGFRYSPPMLRWLARMPVPHRVVFGLMIGSIIVGHYTFDSRKFFPFVAWEIFPAMREEDPVSCREFMATTASGKSVRLLIEQLFPSIIQFNPPANDSAEMGSLINAMARAYDRGHPDDPVRHVDLVQIAVKLHPKSGELPSCQLLKHYEISSAPSP